MSGWKAWRLLISVWTLRTDSESRVDQLDGTVHFELGIPDSYRAIRLSQKLRDGPNERNSLFSIRKGDRRRHVEFVTFCMMILLLFRPIPIRPWLQNSGNPFWIHVSGIANI